MLEHNNLVSIQCIQQISDWAKCFIQEQPNLGGKEGLQTMMRRNIAGRLSVGRVRGFFLFGAQLALNIYIFGSGFVDSNDKGMFGRR